MLKQAVVCNQCGTERKEANHWYHWYVLVEYKKACISLMPLESYPNLRGIVIFSFDDGTASIDDAEHICGESCLQKRMRTRLAELTAQNLETLKP
jgi:hypothetical protein